MAMMDYGAVAKKNGKIISNPKGGLFQNLSSLKWSSESPTEDETMVSGVTTTDIPFTVSMAGNHFVTLGDKEFLIGFYKTHFNVAVNGEMINIHYWRWYDEEYRPVFKPKYFSFCTNSNSLVVVKVERVGRRDSDSQVYLASFSYKGDKYEVLFGYGVDPSLGYTFSKRNYYARNRKHYGQYHNDGNYVFRKTLKFIRTWTYEGLSQEDKEMLVKYYGYKEY